MAKDITCKNGATCHELPNKDWRCCGKKTCETLVGPMPRSSVCDNATK